MENLPISALSIRQPWAWCILNLGKDIENRNWPTRYRGEFAIHAAKGCTQDEFFDCFDFVASGRRAGKIITDVERGPPFKDMERGGIVGVATIVDCVRGTHPSPWFFGTHGFVLANVRPVPFIPVKGALGFFDWRKNLVPAHEPIPTTER